MRAPIGGQRREFADDQSLDIGPLGFLVIQVGADVADVRIGEADDLPGVAGIGEDFLVAGEAGIENDFAAAPGDGSGRAPCKDSPVLERE
jgi:hypothetical protein